MSQNKVGSKKENDQNQSEFANSRAASAGHIRINKGSLKTFARLMKYLKGRWKVSFILSLVLIAAAAFISVRSSLFLGTVIDDYIEPLLLESVPDFSGLLTAVIKMGALYLCSILACTTYNLLLVDVSNGVLYTVRNQMFGHMQTLPIKYFDRNKYGDIMSRYTNDIDNLRQMLSSSIPQVFQSVITIVSIVAAMIKLSWQMSIVVGVVVIVMYAVTAFVGGNSAKFFFQRQKTLGGVNAFIEEMLNGQKVVKVFCHEDESNAEFDEKNENLFRMTYKANAFANILGPIMNNLGNMQYVLIAITGAALAIGGNAGITLGTIASFLTLSKNFSMPVSQVAQQINSVVMALAGMQRIFNLIDEKPEVDDGYVTLVNAAENADGSISESDVRTGVWAWKHPHSDGSITYTKLQGDVTMQDVDFGYEEGNTVLHDVSLYAKPGQKIAFVGSTGAGKTTITNLINRFYDIEDGKIRYDGININKIKKDDLRRSLGMVLQDVNLFTGTIMENIRYGNLEATDEKVIAAAKLANADSFIEKLPDGYNTVINGTGSQLSQGQCQLLSIARCAVANPPVMILDEATSSIDTRTEALIQAGMDKLMAGRTVFVIAHRLSTVQNSDAIMVLEAGRIIERGTHDELIAAKGRYYQLYSGKKE